jgi:hypothetical protein
VGLIHVISKALHRRFQVNIEKVFIDTYSTRARDTFFLTQGGQPLSREKKEEIEDYFREILRQNEIDGASIEDPAELSAQKIRPAYWLKQLVQTDPAVTAELGNLFDPASEMPDPERLNRRPAVLLHRNQDAEDIFLLPPSRFGGTEDVKIVPLIREAVDESLRAFANSMPYLREYLGKIPVMPYGSLALTGRRYGVLDWDHIRDIDIKIYLPPNLGHTSGFKSHLEASLHKKLRPYGLSTVMGGKDESGRPQVQLKDTVSGAIHGFHLFLIEMKPDFLKQAIHDSGGYLLSYSYYPEGVLDPHLTELAARGEGLTWAEIYQRHADNYRGIFGQLNLNVFGAAAGAGRTRQKSPGWYLKKAFKWYALLARRRGWFKLEQEMLKHYQDFQGNEEDLRYLVKQHYFDHFNPDLNEGRDLQRDIARAMRVEYAQAKDPRDAYDGLVLNLSGDGAEEILILEAVEAARSERAIRRIESAAPGSAVREQWESFEKEGLRPSNVRYALGISSPKILVRNLTGGRHEILIVIPEAWSLVLDDAYARQVQSGSGRDLAGIDRALDAVLAAQLLAAVGDVHVIGSRSVSGAPQAQSLGVSIVGRGAAVGEAGKVKKEPFGIQLFETEFNLIEKEARSRRVTEPERQLAGRVYRHLRELAYNRAIFGFDELRWGADSYLVAFSEKDSISLGNGFTDNQGFSVAARAQLLFRLGLKSLAWNPAENLPDYQTDEAVAALEKKLFPRSGFEKRLQQFIDLSDRVFLESALSRFTDFQRGSPVFETFLLFEQWAEADFRKQALPVLNQAGFLAAAFLKTFGEIRGVEKKLAGRNEAEKELITAAYYKLVLPLFSFAIFRNQILDNLRSVRNSVTEEIYEQARKRGMVRATIDLKGSLRSNYKQILIFNETTPFFVSWPGRLRAADPSSPVTPDLFAPWLARYRSVARGMLENDTWLDAHLSALRQKQDEAAGKPENEVQDIAIPGLGWASLKDLAPHFEVMNGRKWHGLATYLNLGEEEHTGFGIYEPSARETWENPWAVVTSLDTVPVGSFFGPQSDIIYGMNRDGTRLYVQRNRQKILWDIHKFLLGKNKDDDPKKNDYFGLLGALVQTRGRVAKRLYGAAGAVELFPAAPKDLLPWTQRLMQFSAEIDLHFAEMMGTHFRSVSSLLEDVAGLSDGDKTLFWYYSLAAHPEGLFSWLAGKHPGVESPLLFVEGTNRLTPPSALLFLDALYGIYWAGLPWAQEYSGKEKMEKARLFYEVMQFVKLTPEGVVIPDPQAFRDFLGRDVNPDVLRKKSISAFREWVKRRYPRGLEETQIDLAPRAAGPPAPGTAYVLESQGPSYFSPVEIPPRDILFPGRWPAENPARAAAVYSGTYSNGIPVPGTSYKYKIPGVPEGARLRITVQNGGFTISGPEGLPPRVWVSLPLGTALSDFAEPGSTWERVPGTLSPEQITAPESGEASADGYYAFPIRENGEVFFKSRGGYVAANVPAEWTGRSLVVQVSGRNLIFYSPDGESYLGRLNGENKFTAGKDSISAALMKPLPAELRNADPRSLKEYQSLAKIAGDALPFLKRGLGYSAAEIVPAGEVRAGDGVLSIPASQIDDPDTLVERLTAALELSDPLVRLEARVQLLKKLEDSLNVFDPAQEIPEILPEIPEEPRRNWTQTQGEAYQNLQESMTETRRRIVVMRRIGSYRNELEEMGRPGRLRAALASLLKHEPRNFYFAARTMWTDNLKSLNRDPAISRVEGVGYISRSYYKSVRGGEIVLRQTDELGPEESEGEKPLIFIRFKKGEQMILALFDPETGEKFDHEQRRRQELLGQVQDRLRERSVDGFAALEMLDHVTDLGDQIEILEFLNDFLPKILISAHPHINSAMARFVFAAFIREGAPLARGLKDRAAKEDPRWLMEEFEYLLLHFGLHPAEDANLAGGGGYARRFADFLENVLLPVERLLWEEAPSFADDKYSDALIDYLSVMKNSIEVLWDIGAITEVSPTSHLWDGEMAVRFGLI